MAEPVELFRDGFSTYYRDDGRKMLELRWNASTKSMSEQQFRDGLSRLAQFTESEQLPNVLIDVTEFGYRPTDDFGPWRETNIIPQYNAAGVKRFAFLMPAGVVATVENGTAPAAEGAAVFPTGYFASRDNALAWLEK